MAFILERCTRLDVGTFKDALKRPKGIWTGTVRWTAAGIEQASIAYRVHTGTVRPVVILTYHADGQFVMQEIELAAVPSNLKRGHYWVFVCPQSGRRCKSLYLIDGLFRHRSAVRGVFYKEQAERRAPLFKYMDIADKAEEILKAADAPYFRERYAGRLTRRAKRMLRKVGKLGTRLDEAGRQMLEDWRR